LQKVKEIFEGFSNCQNCRYGSIANAGAQKPKPLPDDGQHTPTWHQTVMREGYAETADSGFGLLQHFVSAKTAYFTV
jgi:hypothetical protein